MSNTNNVQTTEVSKKRGRPAGVRSAESIAFDKNHAQTQLVKLQARKADLVAEIALVDEKISKHTSTIESLDATLSSDAA